MSCSPVTTALRSHASATVLYVSRPTVARRTPRRGAATVAELQRKNVYDLRTTLLAVAVRSGRDCRTAWYRVKLPRKPNGAVAWVPASAVQARQVTTRLVASLRARRIDLYDNGRRVLAAPIAIGARGTPTPRGLFYVEARFELSDPGGPYGPGALAVAAYSEAEQGWARGNPIAIHGTNAPWSVGTAASHGCLRLRNADIRELMTRVPAGTPVEIRA
jgi:hypothetical protein